jgi:hypothetical protein
MHRRDFLIRAGAVAAAATTKGLDARANMPEPKLLSEIRGSLVARQELTPGQKRLIVDVATNLVEQVYVHRPMKIAQYGVDVVPQLRALRVHAPDMADMAFHREMRRIFVQLRDRHTHYISTGQNEVYVLGITIARAFDGGEWKYFIIQSDDPAIPIGSQIVTWNGGQPEQVVEELAEHVGAGNVASRLAMARQYLTRRLTSKFDPPIENEVRVGIVDPSGGKSDIALNWQVQKIQRKLEVPTEHLHELGIDEPLFLTSESAADSDWVSSRTISFGGRDYGLLQIKTFMSPNNYMDHILEKLRALPPSGLVIDIRQNGGGIISHGENLLQLFAPKPPIQPLTFRFRASDTMATATSITGGTWNPTIVQGMAFGSEYSADFPLTNEKAANKIGRVYPGPVILIVDAITYSTADMFTSGFQSHGIGKIIGVDENIGAGGANNFSSISDLRKLLPKDDPRFPPLPAGVDFGFAVRQAIRRGPYSGMILEDEGIKVDVQYKLTKRDIFPATKDLDLLAYACGLLAA